MCSFHVCSLFTNIPLNKTIDICINKLYSSPSPPNIPPDVLTGTFHFAKKDLHFIFKGKYYDQIDGIAMSNPLASVLANIFIVNFENHFLSFMPADYAKPLTWKMGILFQNGYPTSIIIYNIINFIKKRNLSQPTPKTFGAEKLCIKIFLPWTFQQNYFKPYNKHYLIFLSLCQCQVYFY